MQDKSHTDEWKQWLFEMLAGKGSRKRERVVLEDWGS